MWWHGDLIHGVGDETTDERWGNVMYIPAAPWCERNAVYARLCGEAFLAGRSPADFAAEDWEIDWEGCRAEVEALCADNPMWIAIVNGEDAFVIGGEMSALEAFVAAAGARGAQIVRLHVGVASHTPLLQAAVAPLQAALSESLFRAAATPGGAGCRATRMGTLYRHLVRAWLPVVSGTRPRRSTLENGARTSGCERRGPLRQRISVP